MSYQVVVFDWDGTLVDSESHIVASIEYAAQQMRLPVLSYAQIKNIIGLGMREALLALYPALTEAQVEQARAHYAYHFFTKKTEQSALFDGVIDTLTALQASGVKMAVATGKSRHGLEQALSSTGLRHFFEIERCADETRSKPHVMMLQQIAAHFNLAPAKMLMVGDTEYDLAMAAGFGMDALGVSYGVHEPSRLSKHNPLKIIDHIAEVLTFI